MAGNIGKVPVHVEPGPEQGYVKISNDVVRDWPSTPEALQVYLLLLSHDGHGGFSESVKGIAQRYGWKWERANRAVVALESVGLLARTVTRWDVRRAPSCPPGTVASAQQSPVPTIAPAQDPLPKRETPPLPKWETPSPEMGDPPSPVSVDPPSPKTGDLRRPSKKTNKKTNLEDQRKKTNGREADDDWEAFAAGFRAELRGEPESYDDGYDYDEGSYDYGDGYEESYA